MSWLARIFGTPASPGAATPVSRSAEAADAVDLAVDSARRWVRAGYYSREEIADWVADIAEDEGLDPYIFDADGLVAREIADLRAEQMHWPAVTEWDRLDAALEALEMNGIVARQDFTCCGSCGMAEIDAEIDRFEARGVTARGYVFFHQQDTESAVDGQGLYFNYGGRDTGERSALRVGEELVQALRRAGLKPKWNGDLGRRIFLPIDWKRRWTDG